MKTKHLILSLLALFASITSYADDYVVGQTFTVTEGIKIGGVWCSMECEIIRVYPNNACEVTLYPQRSFYWDDWKDKVADNFEIEIPVNVFYNSAGFTVTSVGKPGERYGSQFFLFGGTHITKIILPPTIESIISSAFNGCGNGLTEVSGADNLKILGFAAFANNHNLESFPDLADFAHVEEIGAAAFHNCRSLRTLNLASIKKLGLGAFRGCKGLTSIELGEQLEDSIPYECFMNCEELTQIKIPEGVYGIGSNAFRGCEKLTSIDIPSSVNWIGNYAFAFNYSRPATYTVHATTPPTIESDVDLFCKKDTIYVPFGCADAYLAAPGWKKGIIIEMEDNSPKVIEDLSELSNNKQYLIHTRDKNRGSLGVTEKHLASTNPNAYGPWVCKPVVLDKDNPLITSVNQLSSPNTDPTEGSLDAMIDGNANSFWHSNWHEAVEPGSHYFQVEMLNQANIDVAFKVVRRQTDDNHITEWGVYGTNNANASKEECAPLAVIETPYSGWGETRVSDIFKTGGYKYLRFYINKTTRSNFGHLAEFQLYPATTNEAYGDASPFAIIQKNGGYYLYSVLDKAFITPVNDGDENTNPLLPSDNKMDIYKQEDHFVFSFVETDYTINVNQKGVVINDYGKINGSYDDGNLFTIEEVGAFDPTEALAKFETQIFTVTYNVMYEGNLVATATEQVPSGDALPPAPASIDNGFVTLTKTGTHPTTVTGNVTVTYNATWNGPFEFTKTLDNAKWYNMHIRSGYYVGKQDTEPYYPTQDVDEATLATPAYHWAFGGDPYHVKVYNRTTGLSETLTKDSVNAVMRSGDYTWDLLPNNDGFVLRVSGTENTCINQFGGSSGPLQFWTNDNSPKDNGSTFRVEKALGLPDYVITDETTSFSITTQESGMAIEFTHSYNGEWEALYLPFAIDYDAIKADFDLAEIDGVVQNDENNDGTPDITVLSVIGFKEQTTTPNKPYLIRAKNAGEQTLQFDDVTVYPTVSSSIDCASTSIRYEFTGSYNTLNASALTNRYVVQDGELVKGASSLAPCRWYMTATARNGAPLNLPNRIRIMSVEDVITGSPLLISPEEEGLIYNVSGQRLNKMQKGINITNGKKVVLK